MSIDFDHSTTGILEPIADHIIVEDIESESEKVVNGIILPSELGANRGIRPRWAHICAVGPDQEDVSVGQWVLIEHGRWTRGVKLDDGIVYRKADPDGLLLVSDEKPDEA